MLQNGRTPRRQTKELHKLQLITSPRILHTTHMNATNEGEGTEEGENVQSMRSYKPQKEPDEQTPRIFNN